MLLDRGVHLKVLPDRLYLPVVLSMALIGFIWQLMFSRDQVLNTRCSGTPDRLVRRPEDQPLVGGP